MPTTAAILVVGDDPSMLSTLRALLAEQHWQVHEAENGKIALERIRQVNPDVVVLDIVKPEMSGVETAYEIGLMAPAPKVIFISNDFTFEEGTMIARLYGDGHFVPKAEIGKELVPMINRLLGKKGKRGKAAGSK
jgi:DNA-binding response OmpR family regulator